MPTKLITDAARIWAQCVLTAELKLLASHDIIANTFCISSKPSEQPCEVGAIVTQYFIDKQRSRNILSTCEKSILFKFSETATETKD